MSLDIDELNLKGKGNYFCPYYYSMIQAKDADLLLIPYNYILDKKIFKQD
jgi:regulator of telomere elongation helicase 1